MTAEPGAPLGVFAPACRQARAGHGCLTKICTPIILTVDLNKTRIYRMLDRLQWASASR